MKPTTALLSLRFLHAHAYSLKMNSARKFVNLYIISHVKKEIHTYPISFRTEDTWLNTLLNLSIYKDCAIATYKCCMENDWRSKDDLAFEFEPTIVNGLQNKGYQIK